MYEIFTQKNKIRLNQRSQYYWACVYRILKELNEEIVFLIELYKEKLKEKAKTNSK